MTIVIIEQTINGVSNEFKISDECKYCNKKIDFGKESFTIIDNRDAYHEECEFLAFPNDNEDEDLEEQECGHGEEEK